MLVFTNTLMYNKYSRVSLIATLVGALNILRPTNEKLNRCLIYYFHLYI